MTVDTITDRIVDHDHLGDVKYLQCGLHYRYAVGGSCHGVILRDRGPKDRHVTMTFIVEDDGTWFVKEGSSTSSFWIDEYIEVLAKTKKWMKNNCDKDPTGYGYVFKT